MGSKLKNGTIEKKEERQAMAEKIVELMMQMHPQNRNIDDAEKILLDLMCIFLQYHHSPNINSVESDDLHTHMKLLRETANPSL